MMPLQMVKTQLTSDFRFGQLLPTVSNLLEISGGTSCEWTNNMQSRGFVMEK